MFFNNDSKVNHGHPMPNIPRDDMYRHIQPDKPHLPVRPDHPEHPTHPEKPKEPIVIIVNGVDKILAAGTKQLSYEDVVKMAYPNFNGANSIIYTVVFSNGPVENKRGTLVKGDVVQVWGGMIFNVGKSNKS